jgi:hypothetical protein
LVVFAENDLLPVSTSSDSRARRGGRAQFMTSVLDERSKLADVHRLPHTPGGSGLKRLSGRQSRLKSRLDHPLPRAPLFLRSEHKE